jgi:hypothetical protein
MMSTSSFSDTTMMGSSRGFSMKADCDISLFVLLEVDVFLINTDPTIRGFFRRRVPMEGSGNLINAILSYLL